MTNFQMHGAGLQTAYKMPFLARMKNKMKERENSPKYSNLHEMSLITMN